ncbi:EF-P beta-lysylation protein EpmB [Aliikangiella coralliicola]|uniref:L-lysine 2,3-aminomutase n=1 Tax=Aliikangiella coralliicola TaxID=2592383 RepID=A0A545UBY3_9GAMM|nr:EF-P beta-lysylation protein EpmB [Aliikangiella coralliicola]TQV86976.1 EF-P beta-lysylation protein EpmB [Aliikangiella coralliicola]
MKNVTPIIPVSEPDCQVKSWKNFLKEAVSDPLELLQDLNLKPEDIEYAIDPSNPFKVRVPRPFIEKMRIGDPDDPLLRQVLSLDIENADFEGYSSDPLKETNSDTPGLLHKYEGRVLLILASACAVNCRYCFRRHFPYQDKVANGDSLKESLAYIKNNPTIKEVILSGGDPLIVSDGFLQSLVDELDTIKHLKRLRIHSRLPIVIPQRISRELCNIFNKTRLKSSLVLHINHGNEIDSALIKSLNKLTEVGVQLLNQSVLLKGVNDSVQALVQLSERLFEAGILPYYVHMLDKVDGAAHFDISQAKAVALMNQIREQLPGYLVPRLAVEEPGKGSKTVIT